MGPQPDGQIRDITEVMLGTATRIGETLALRKCDVDMDADPPLVYINGTVLVKTGVGVARQAHPKTHESKRVVGVPQFAPLVIRRRLESIAGEDDEHPIFLAYRGGESAAQRSTHLSHYSQECGTRGPRDHTSCLPPNRSNHPRK
jgi:integrase